MLRTVAAALAVGTAALAVSVAADVPTGERAAAQVGELRVEAAPGWKRPNHPPCLTCARPGF